MPVKSTDDTVKLVIRLPRPLHKRLTRQAARNNRSLNDEMVQRLKGYDRGAIELTADYADALTAEVQKRLAQITPSLSELERGLKSMQALLAASKTGEPDEK
jgi:hypothetical protein